MTEQEGLLPAEAARRLGVPTRAVVQAMYEKRLSRVKLDDGTLGIPAAALDSFRAQAVSRRTAAMHARSVNRA